MVRLWERLVLDQPGRKELPLIVPLLLHHSDTGWTAATAFQDLIDLDDPARAALERHVPRFEVRLIDLSEGRAAHLVEEALTSLGKVVLWSLSVAGNDERFAREVDHIAAALEQVLAALSARAALEALLRYLAATRVRMPAAQVNEILIEAVSRNSKEIIVDYVEEMRREGKREGLEQVLLKQLAARFGAVPPGVKERVGAATDATLEKWALRVLTAPTLEAVIEPQAAPAAPRRRAAPRKRTSRT